MYGGPVNFGWMLWNDALPKVSLHSSVTSEGPRAQGHTLEKLVVRQTNLRETQKPWKDPLQQSLRQINLQRPREMQKPWKVATEYLKEPVEGNIEKQENSISI